MSRWGFALILALGPTLSAGSVPWWREIQCEQALRETPDVHAVLKFIERRARDEFPRGPTSETYAAYTVERSGSQTLHVPMGRVSLDSRWILDLPQQPSARLWSRLSVRQKAFLVEGLESLYGLGQPDREMLRPKDSTLRMDPLDWPTFWALQRKSQNGEPIGFSPLRFLGGALRERCIGVCRHFNVAIIGLLLELGATRGEVRLRSGWPESEGKDGHLFGEVRLAPDGEWQPVDVNWGFDLQPGSDSLGPEGFDERKFVIGESLALEVREIHRRLFRLPEQFSRNAIVDEEFAEPQLPWAEADFDTLFKGLGSKAGTAYDPRDPGDED